MRLSNIRFSMVALLVGYFVFGCTSADRSSPSPVSSPLVGQWRQITLGVGKQSKQCPASFMVSDGGSISCGGHDTLEFRPDGTFVARFSNVGLLATGSWQLQGSTLRVTFTTPREIAGVSRSTTIEVGQGAKSVTIKTSTEGTPTVETYVRD